MNHSKKPCNNYNHGKVSPPVAFCPTCGGKFSSPSQGQRPCNTETHKADRKNRSAFCSCCGKDLSKP